MGNLAASGQGKAQWATWVTVTEVDTVLISELSVGPVTEVDTVLISELSAGPVTEVDSVLVSEPTAV